MSPIDPKHPTRAAPAGTSRAHLLASEAEQQLARNRFDEASRKLAGALALAPRDARVLRVQAALLNRVGRHADALALLRGVLETSPADAALLDQLAQAQRQSGDNAAAIESWRRATTEFADSAEAWFNLGRALAADASIDDAAAALAHAVSLAPEHRVARVMLGDTCAQLGRIDEAIAQYRAVIDARPDTAHAWWGLANLKTVRFDATDLARMEAEMRRADLPEHHRDVLGFALARAYEDHDRYDDAFAALVDANRRMRSRLPWDAARFRAAIERANAVLSARDVGATARVSGDALGHEIIFVVSLPRSGSTLVEQMLAAHSEVEGASELADLEAVLRAESRRRGVEFPAWTSAATPDDWARLGRAYLERTARWRTQKPRSTDKTPGNWTYLGAIRAMLPGARIVDCRRDPLETALGCFRQVFASGQAFSYDLADIVDYLRVHDRAVEFWHERAPDSVRIQSYEALLADPEGQIRALLDFCALPFEPACLAFHEARRAVRTASAAQIREPLRRDTARAPRYGRSLDTLRSLLNR